MTTEKEKTNDTFTLQHAPGEGFAWAVGQVLFGNSTMYNDLEPQLLSKTPPNRDPLSMELYRFRTLEECIKASIECSWVYDDCQKCPEQHCPGKACPVVPCVHLHRIHDDSEKGWHYHCGKLGLNLEEVSNIEGCGGFTREGFSELYPGTALENWETWIARKLRAEGWRHNEDLTEWWRPDGDYPYWWGIEEYDSWNPASHIFNIPGVGY